VAPATTFVANLGYVAVAVVGGLQVATGHITLGSVQAFMQYVRQFNTPLSQMAGMYNTLQSGGVLASEKDPHEGAKALRAFNDKIVNDPRVVCVMTTIRDGVTLIRRAG